MEKANLMTQVSKSPHRPWWNIISGTLLLLLLLPASTLAIWWPASLSVPPGSCFLPPVRPTIRFSCSLESLNLCPVKDLPPPPLTLAGLKLQYSMGRDSCITVYCIFAFRVSAGEELVPVSLLKGQISFGSSFVVVPLILKGRCES